MFPPSPDADLADGRELSAGGQRITAFARQAGMALSVVDAGWHGFRQAPRADAGVLEPPTIWKCQPWTRPVGPQPWPEGELARMSRPNRAATWWFGEMGIGTPLRASPRPTARPAPSLTSWLAAAQGWNDAGLACKRRLLAQAVARGGGRPIRQLCPHGGFEIASDGRAMLSVLPKRGTILLIDGFIVTSALLVAHICAWRSRLLGCVRPLLPGARPRRATRPYFNNDNVVASGSAANSAKALKIPLAQAASELSTRWRASTLPVSVSGLNPIGHP